MKGRWRVASDHVVKPSRQGKGLEVLNRLLVSRKEDGRGRAPSPRERARTLGAGDQEYLFAPAEASDKPLQVLPGHWKFGTYINEHVT